MKSFHYRCCRLEKKDIRNHIQDLPSHRLTAATVIGLLPGRVELPMTQTERHLLRVLMPTRMTGYRLMCLVHLTSGTVTRLTKTDITAAEGAVTTVENHETTSHGQAG